MITTSKLTYAYPGQLPDHSHFIPMEIPGWMARRIAAFADRDD